MMTDGIVKSHAGAETRRHEGDEVTRRNEKIVRVGWQVELTIAVHSPIRSS
jgi:hypothetical protein